MRFDSPSNFGPAHFATTGTTAELDFDDIDAVAQPQPTEGQMKFVTDLRAAWQEAEDEIARLTGREARRPAWVDPASREEASAMIDRGKDARDAIRAELREARRSVRVAGRVEVTEGMWIVGEIIEGMQPEIYKVQIAVHGSGRPYAKRLYADGFAYEQGGMRRIAEAGRKMTLDEAKSYGRLYGVCCKCGATLTDERSIEAGIGPVCAGRGW
jgi:hypothetical protein